MSAQDRSAASDLGWIGRVLRRNAVNKATRKEQPMEGFTPLEINLNGDDAWPELRDKDFGHGIATHVAVLADGTSGGKPSVAIRGKLDDGTEVVIETTWNLLYSAARAIEARYGGAR